MPWMREILISFGLIIATGIIIKRLRPGGLDAESLRSGINGAVLNVFLPALCIHTLSTAEIGVEAVLVPVTAMGSTIAGLVLALFVYRVLRGVLRIAPREEGVLVLSATFGNVTYLGLPVLTGLYGPEAARYALFYDLLATTPLLWLVGAPIAARFGEGRKPDVRESLRAIVSLPPVWAIFLGMAMSLSGIRLPAAVLLALEMLGRVVVPLMVFSIGLAVSLPRVRHAWAVLPAVVLKLVVVPFISLGIAYGLGLSGMALSSCLIEGAMPTMVLSLLIAARFGLDVSLSAFVIVVTTAISFFSLPLIIKASSFLPWIR